MPQYRRAQNPPAHQFVVFSVIAGDDVVPKFVQCNNCGIVHKVTEVNRSEVVAGRESMQSIVSVNDVRQSVPPRLCELLDANNADVATWEAAKHMYEREEWGGFVVLTSDEEDGMKQGKYVRVLGKNLFSVDVYARDEVVS